MLTIARILLLVIAPVTVLAACTASWHFHDSYVANDPWQSQYGCTYDRKVSCSSPPTRKALVMYMLTNNEDEYSASIEWDSFAFFLQQGLLGEHEKTEMFSRVDYVFTRISKEVTAVSKCAEKGNLKLFWVPPGPCDLCAHSLVMKVIDIRQYDTIIFMNSGVRGPFLSPKSSHWIDVVATAGLTDFDNSAGYEGKPTVVSAAQVSWMHTMHPQSYFLVVPKRANELVVDNLFASTCPKTKFACAIEGEVALGWTLIGKGVGVHSLGRNFSILSPQDNDAIMPKHKVPEPPNPCLWPQEPCNTVFLKFGGDVFRTKYYSRRMIRMVNQLTALAPSVTNPAHAEFVQLLEKCDYLRGTKSY